MDRHDTPMQPIDRLMSEHREIERVATCLMRMALRARDEHALELTDALDAITFLREFADRAHHGKEEQFLFPALERQGMPRDHGPTSVMRAEHDMGRGHLRGMAETVTHAAASASPERDRFVGHALDFVTLIREHIEKEDQVLFPMADRMLDDAARAQLAAEFAQVDGRDIGPEAYVRLGAMADRLCERYKVTAADARAHSGGGRG